MATLSLRLPEWEATLIELPSTLTKELSMITTRFTRLGAAAPLALAFLLAGAAVAPAQDAEQESPAMEEPATGEAKVDAIAAVVTELVAQRRAMHQMMAEMQPMMMGHGVEGMHHSMADCPMMKKGSPDADEGGEPEHSEHHPEG